MADNFYEVIIIGGSAAGLSAALTLGRSLRNVLVIDSCEPCNIQTPRSHNFLTQDGKTPQEIVDVAKDQLKTYNNVTFVEDKVTTATCSDGTFTLRTASSREYTADRLLLATGLRDIMPDVEGFAECWGISVLHCPYCHGYEVSNKPTAIFANGEAAYHLGVLINNWTQDITVLTNGISELRFEEAEKLEELGVVVNGKEVKRFRHNNGQLESVEFSDGTSLDIGVVYASIPFEQQSDIAAQLGCKISSHKHIDVDDEQRTSITGVYAAGDCTAQQRAISVAAASGTKAGFTINLDVILNKMPSAK